MTRTRIPAALIGFLLSSGPVFAHALLRSATPGVGGTVLQSPSQVVIAFTEGIELSFSAITVQDGAGAGVESGAVHLGDDDRHLVVPLKPLPPGSYKVTWHVTSVDTHKTEGSFSFTVAQ